jgi:hypothetical protein
MFQILRNRPKENVLRALLTEDDSSIKHKVEDLIALMTLIVL